MVRIALAIVLLLAAGAHAADRTTAQVLHLPGGDLPFTAAVETIKLADPKGAPVAELVTTAFLRDEPNRPITFAINGGPGASSAWLDVGAVGPWRVPVHIPIVPSQDPGPVDNAETWLGFTDLVFIDPVGTGFSRATGDPKPFWTIDGDINSIATTIRRWLEAHGRLGAPVVLLGESYGGFRLPRLARALAQQQGVGVGGLVMVSPVLDFNGRDAPYDPMQAVGVLPSMVAAARHATSRADIGDVEAYAAGPYLTDLVRGPNDAAAVARITERVAAMTGLDPALVRRRGGRPDWESVLRDRVPGRIASPYDATISADDPFPELAHDRGPDPILDGLRAPVTEAMLTVYRRLDWQPDGAPARHYDLLSDEVGHGWDWGHSMVRPQSMTALRQFLALDPTARAVVVHGLTDLVTPYFASGLLLDQVPVPPERLSLRVLPGGHMSYLFDGSRAALRDVGAAMITAVAAARTPEPAAAPTPSPAPPATAPSTAPSMH